MAYRDVMTLATVNFRAFWGTKDRNLARIKDYIIAAAKRGADLIALPELALTGYENQPDVPQAERMHCKLAELVPGPSVTEVAEVTKQYGIYAVFGMVERDPEIPTKLYNIVAVCGPEGYIGKYRKIHPANDENSWSSKGDEPLLFETPWGPVGVGICYDTYSFPELMRYYGAKGARLYVNSTALGGLGKITFDWKQCYFGSMEHQVVANDMFIVSSNLVGVDIQSEEFANLMGDPTVPQFSYFAGASCILGPGYKEKVHCYAGGTDYNEADMFIATVDLSNASRMIFNKNPWGGQPDFRPKMYKKMAEDLLQDEYWQKYE